MYDQVSVDGLLDSVLRWYPSQFGCLTRWHSPAEGLSHSPCLPPSQQSEGRQLCSGQTWQKCQSQSSSYVLATTNGSHTLYRNRHCLSCDLHGQRISCRPAHEEELNVPVQSFFSAELVWNPGNRTWTVWGRASHSFTTYDLSFHTSVCDATDLTPSNCRVVSCHPGYDLGNGTCHLRDPERPKLTVWVTLDVLPLNSSEGVNATAVLEDLALLGDKINSDFNDTVSKQTTGLRQRPQYWTFTVRIFTFYDYENGVSLIIDAIEDAALATFQHHGINLTRFCFETQSSHVTYDLPCFNYETYVLQLEREREHFPTDWNFAVPTERSVGGRGGGGQEGGRWRRWVSVACIAVSAVSCVVPAGLHLLSWVRGGSAGGRHPCLCLAFLLHFLLLLTGRLLDPGSWVCRLSAVAAHWALLCGHLWVNSHAALTWVSFRSDIFKRQGRSETTLHRGWHVYAWFSPLLLVVPAVVLDWTGAGGALGGVYGADGAGPCWFHRGRAMLVFVAGPSLLLSVLNLGFVLHTVYVLLSMKAKLGDIPSSVFVEVRTNTLLVIPVGVTWLLGIPVAVFSESVLDDIFTLTHTSLGFFLTLVIMGNRPAPKSVQKRKRRLEARDKGRVTSTPPAPSITTTTSSSAPVPPAEGTGPPPPLRVTTLP